MAKQNFLGLVRIKGTWAQYEPHRVDGKLVFAEISADPSKGKYIWANGLEYKVADTTDLEELIQRVNNLDLSVADISSWKREVEEWIPKVNSSIAALETSTNTLETWRAHIDNVSVDGINASVADLSTKMVNANASIADLSTRMKAVEAFDDRIDSLEASMGIVESSINKLETSVGGLLKSATLSATAAENVATVQVDTLTDAGTPATSSITVTGDAYVAVGQDAANKLTLTTKLGDIATATEDASGLATAYDVSAFVKSQIQDLEGALVFRGGAASDEDLPDNAEKGDVYVATAGWESTDAGATIEAGDLLICKNDNPVQWVVVERNLDGAVESGETLTDGTLIIGKGNQSIGTSSVTEIALTTAIANANSAIQDVDATSSNAYVTATAAVSSSTATVTIDLANTVVETSTALSTVSATGSFVDAKAVKDLVDAKAAEVKVSATLNSSTPDYVDASAVVDAAGRVISASVGVKVVDLSTAAAKGDGLADAFDVRNRLEEVEEVMATAVDTMAETLGMNSSFGVDWTDSEWAGWSYKQAIEEVAEQAAQSGVTSFGEKKGAISIDTTVATDGSVNFAMNSSTLTGTVVGWSELVTRVSNNESSIGEVSTRVNEVSTRVNEVSTRLNDLSTYVRQTVDASIDALQAKDTEIDASIDALQAKDTEIDASIDRLDASVSALENRTITGESEALTNPNDAYVNVAATTDAQGNVTLDSSVQLANPVEFAEGETHATPTGLATDAWVKDFLAWETIGD